MRDILIVEDEPSERDHLKHLFERAGYSVLAAASVDSAQEILQNEKVRLAILDIGLGDRSGSYLFEYLRRTARAHFVLILTGNPSPHLQKRLTDEGAVDYIVKGSPRAADAMLAERVHSILGTPLPPHERRMPLGDFLQRFLPEPMRALFMDVDDQFPACRGCGSRNYVVTFEDRTQVPPEVNGIVVCEGCGRAMDREVL